MPSFQEQVSDDLHRLFAVTGRRCFLIGALHGGFPDLGHHLPGEMGGIWAFPIKLADGFWFGLSQQGEHSSGTGWMFGAACRRFTLRPGEVERDYRLTVGSTQIETNQHLFVPDEEAGVLVDVTLHNSSPEPARLTLHWLTRFDIQGAWWSNLPDRPDSARYEETWGGVLAWDTGREEWSAAILSGQIPARHNVGPDEWGPERTGSLTGKQGRKRGGILPNPDELQGAGTSAHLEYDVTLGPGERQTLRFALAGSAQGCDFAQRKAMELLARRGELLRQKRERQEKLLASVSSISTPVPGLDRVYDLQNLCMDMMKLDLPGVGAGAVAGLPSFAWFFGCDTYYSVGGLLVSGQAHTAVETLRILANYARAQRGRTPHEITPTGRLFNPGNSVETGEYVTAVEHTFRWTGDRAFLEETYDVCKEGIFDYLLGECAADGSFLPDGAGLLELSSAHRGKKLDVAAALHQGLRSLGYLADAMGDAATAARCTELREKVRAAIERHFWQEDRGEYVWRIEQDLTVRRDEPAHTYVMLEMAALDGSDPRLNGLFDTIEGPEHTGPKGVIHPGTTDFVMPIQNAILALAELQYGRPDKGLWYLERMAELCGYGMPGAIPEFEAEQGTAKACFLQLWSSAAFNRLMVQGWFRLLPDPQQGIVWVRPQLPTGWDGAQVRNLTIWGRRFNLSLQRRGSSIALDVEVLSGDGAHPFRVDTQPALPAVFV